ncbi:DUF417 family protein [uncultured Rothia sp.]|uniref:DUF417 family protein n=1 Tax=uncultured Rothia sp. TaxID=316088 RepID=UPI003217DE57
MSKRKKENKSPINKAIDLIANLDFIGKNLTKLGLVVVTLWIGGLKVTKYESEGIIPFVANSPFFKWMINHPEEYKEHKNPEGAVVAANQAWHESNGTYSVGIFIGATIVLIGLLIAAGWIRAEFSLIGGLLLAGMSLVTFSFLITTPEVWVPNLGGPDHGFPYLATPGRLVIKDAIMLGASLWVASDSAQQIIRRRQA